MQQFLLSVSLQCVLSVTHIYNVSIHCKVSSLKQYVPIYFSPRFTVCNIWLNNKIIITNRSVCVDIKSPVGYGKRILAYYWNRKTYTLGVC